MVNVVKSADYQSPQSANELLQRYQNGERYFGATDLDQETLDFSGVFLEGIIFAPRSFLTIDFRNANLKGADFSDCNVKTCDFRGADLEDACFRNATIEAAQFHDANLKNCDFAGAYCYNKVLIAGEQPDW